MKNQSLQPTIYKIFPCPVFIVKRNLELSFKEYEDVQDVIKEGMHKSQGNSISDNNYIFNNKLKEIKQFCEQQIKIYAEEVINPKEDLDFYITQSWLNITKPGQFHHSHYHSNSIISGVFYISTEENDRITFQDPNLKIKKLISFVEKKYNVWNSPIGSFPSITNELVLFPSWLNHKVDINEKATKDRISISFNTFVKGNLGTRKDLTEIII